MAKRGRSERYVCRLGSGESCEVGNRVSKLTELSTMRAEPRQNSGVGAADAGAGAGVLRSDRRPGVPPPGVPRSVPLPELVGAGLVDGAVAGSVAVVLGAVVDGAVWLVGAASAPP